MFFVWHFLLRDGATEVLLGEVAGLELLAVDALTVLYLLGTILLYLLELG